MVPGPHRAHVDGGRAALTTAGEPRSADFTELVEAHRAELHAHCYRMLGSVHDADDALQETMLRAWRGWAGLRDAGAARAWLYAIATNVCRTELRRGSKRVLPHDFGPAADEHTPPGQPIAESVWLEPYPDQAMGLPEGKMSPESRYEQREAVELAFVAALQHLPANQRATLLLRDVLGFSAREAADTLSTSVASVNSALQRARAAVAKRIQGRSQQATLRALGDRGLRDLVQRYVAAWERCDVDAFAALLANDATFAMPPLRTWYIPRASIITWARKSSLSGMWRWRTVCTTANAQPALAFYAWDDGAGAYLPFALNVLTLRDGLVCDVTAFIVRATDSVEPESYQRFPEQPMDARRLTGTFERFGLPDRIG
ncbi:MAG TPA: RNA polymerase subunit sigma-70 [Jatrophihabitans sp.]|nr:RNA polymerase subunit sigma-70 [Jatrophihabitans sp.]